MQGKGASTRYIQNREKLDSSFASDEVTVSSGEINEVVSLCEVVSPIFELRLLKEERRDSSSRLRLYGRQ